METRDNLERTTAGRLSARLQTLIGARRNVADFAALRDEGARLLGPDHEVSLEIECTLETLRDRNRTAADSLVVWEGLRERARASLAPLAATAIAIRGRHLRQLRACGQPDDLDVLVDLCRAEVTRRATDPDLLGAARVDLAWVLRDRSWFGASHATELDPDLAEATALIEEEVLRAGPDQVATHAARLVQAEVLLAASRADPGAPARALEVAETLVRLDNAEDTGRGAAAFDQLPHPHVLLAEALLHNGRTREAGRVARLAYAMHAGSGVFDPARPLLALARSEAGATPAAAGETARAALRQRLATFPADSHYVAEARRLVDELPG